MNVNKLLILITALITVTFFLNFAKSENIDPVYTIKGFVIDFMSGSLISDGNVTAIVKETGEKNSTNFYNGHFEINLSSILDYTQNRFTIGLFINSSDKTGYSQLRIGSGSNAEQTQTCSRKQWFFKGNAIDSQTGNTIDNGQITISIKDTNEINSTNFYNGAWSIILSPCLISGEIYRFQFYIEGSNKKGYMFLNQVAK